MAEKSKDQAKRGQKVIRIGTRWGTDDTKLTAVSFIILPKNPKFINLKIVISKKLKIHGLRLNKKGDRKKRNDRNSVGNR